MQLRRHLIIAGLALGFAGIVHADVGDDVITPDLIHHEVPGDAYMPNFWRGIPWAVPGYPEGALTPGVQVNVDANGNNIPGDAANEPSIAVDPTAPNRIVIGWRQFDTIASNFRQAGNAWSNDGGRTWNNNPVIEPGVFRSDPVLDADSDGAFYYYSLTTVGGDFVCDLFKSDDGGQSWLPGVSAGGGDKQWFSVDRTDGIGQDNIYCVWSPFFSCCPEGNFNRSVDGGQSFMTPLALPSDLFWGATTVTDQGLVYLAGVDLSFEPRIMRSSTAQNPIQFPTFDINTPVDLGGDLVQGGGPNPGGLLGQVWVAVDPSNPDNVYICASVNPPGSDPMDVRFARSTDGGFTWDAPVTVGPDGGDDYQWFGTMSVAPNGRIDVIWNDTRNGIGDSTSELFYSSSSDGGVTWTPAEVLSPSFNSMIGWPNQNKLGDYYHMISDLTGAHLAWAATHNGEQDVYYYRIGDYDCNGNGIGDTDDLANATSDDCNENGIPDECDIAAGVLVDDNGNGIPDECEKDVLGDVDGDGDVDIQDLLALLALWGDCPAECAADFDNNGVVNINDLLTLLANWSGA